ncbi:MAG: 2-oxoacid:acceptor oxidoreductase family protein [Thermodesulfobacteriota bacterium]|nr:2-oxoacid:acceptor oxidoreductase family protein [Thermodesulfobacteriota bacterium]
MKQGRYEICLSGSGGQGIILAALVLAEAAGIFERREVCQSQSYGPEARGGTSKADVIISDEPIDYPKVIQPDLLLSMNQEACDTYFQYLKPEGLLVIDSSLVDQIPTKRVVAIPFTQIARKVLRKEGAANMVALGALGVLSQIISPKSLEGALMKRAPKGSEKINRKALHTGIKEAQRINIKELPPLITKEEEEEI